MSKFYNHDQISFDIIELSKKLSYKVQKIPAIILRKWLAKCYFNIGDHINVEVSDGQLVVKKLTHFT